MIEKYGCVTQFKAFMDEDRKRGMRILFFTTEHSREASLRSELGQVTRFEKLTTKTQK